MEVYEKLLAYWQSGMTTLEYFYPTTFQGTEISTSECNTGKITPALSQPIFLESKLEYDLQSLDAVIAPVFLKQKQPSHTFNGDNIAPLCILCLQAKITREGEILPNKAQPLPWIPRILTEPTTTAPFTLGNNAQFDHYYHFSPPSWGKEGPETWQDQLAYGQSFLDDIAKGAWLQHADQFGYQLADAAIVIPIKSITNNQRLLEIVKKKQRWQKIFTSPQEQIVQQEFDFNYKKSMMHFAHINSKYSLIKQQREALTLAVNLKPNQVFYVQAGPGTGKTLVLEDLIASLWTKAVIENKSPPTIARSNGKTLQKVTILDCLTDGNCWLNKQQKTVFYGNDFGVELKLDIIKHFLAQCTREFNRTIINLEEAKEVLFTRIMLLQTALVQSIEAACCYDLIANKIDVNYRIHGGIERRNKDLKEDLEKQNSYYHYLETLQLLWQKQITPSSWWRQWLEYLPFWKHRKTEKLRVFLEKHLPEEDLTELNIVQMQQYLQNLLLHAEQKCHALSDLLAQIEIDLQQLKLAKIKLKRWIPEQLEKEFELAKFMKSLDLKLRYRLFLTVMHYWETELLQTISHGQNNIFNYYSNSNIAIKDLIQQPVDWLLIENGEDLSPIDGFYCIEGSERLIVMGESHLNNFDRLPMEIDVNLLKQHKLVEVEEDIEDLQLAGLLLSNGQFNTYLEQIADYTGEQYRLYKQWDAAYKIVECYNQLSHTNKLQACCNSKNKFLSNFAYFPVAGYKRSFIGSFRNDAEITTIINWIKQNEAAILAHYPEYSFTDIILIVTPFYGQCKALQEACNQANIEINVASVHMLDNKRVPIVIFSPVYTNEDKGMLNFDQGEKVLKGLILKAKEHILVFGNCQIFDQHLNSASGKFARFLLESKKNELFIPQLVDF